MAAFVHQCCAARAFLLNIFRLTKMFSVVDQKINSDSLHNLNFRINQFRTFRCPLPPTPPVCRCLRRSFASHSPAPGTFTALPDRAPSYLHELCGQSPLPPSTERRAPNSYYLLPSPCSGPLYHLPIINRVPGVQLLRASPRPRNSSGLIRARRKAYGRVYVDAHRVDVLAPFGARAHLRSRAPNFFADEAVTFGGEPAGGGKPIPPLVEAHPASETLPLAPPLPLIPPLLLLRSRPRVSGDD